MPVIKYIGNTDDYTDPIMSAVWDKDQTRDVTQSQWQSLLDSGRFIDATPYQNPVSNAKVVTNPVTGKIGISAAGVPIILPLPAGGRARTVVYGDSYAAYENFPTYGIGQFDGSLWHVALARAGYHRITPVYHGVAGDTTAMMRARLSAVVDAAPDVVLGNGGVNDIYGYDRAVDDVLADVQDMISVLLAAGARVVWANCPTQRTTRSNYTLAKQKKALEYNRRLGQWAAGRPGLVIADLAAAIADPDDSTSAQPLTAAMATDGIHLSRHGAVLFGRSVYSALAVTLPERGARTTDVLDGYGEAGSINGIAPGVGQMAGTGGTAGTGVTAGAAGIPAGWSVARTSGSVVTTVANKVSDTGGTWLELAITGNTPSAAEVVRVQTLSNYSGNFAAAAAAGKSMRLVCELDVESDQGLSITDLNVRLYSYDGAAIRNSEWSRNVAGTLQCNAFRLGERMTIETPLMAIPTGLTDCRPYIYVGVQGNGSAKVRVRNLAIEIVD